MRLPICCLSYSVGPILMKYSMIYKVEFYKLNFVLFYMELIRSTSLIKESCFRTNYKVLKLFFCQPRILFYPLNKVMGSNHYWPIIETDYHSTCSPDHQTARGCLW